MKSSHHLIIKGFENPEEFVEEWSSYYEYPDTNKYSTHINDVLKNKDSFIKLYEWKNGTGSVISENKLKVVKSFLDKYEVLNDLKRNFSWDVFEKEFQPMKSSTIWKIFLLHLIKPNEFPIYDQHVYRFYSFYRDGILQEIPNNNKIKYNNYKNDYKPWFNSVQKKYNLDHKKMDESFFVFGRFLKTLKKYPYMIT